MMMRKDLAGLALLALAVCGVKAGAAAPDDAQPAASKPMVGYVGAESFEKEVLQSDIPVLVDFTATWCAPCKIVDPIIESLMPEMEGRAKVFKLDIDESPEIYKRLAVNGVPNVLFFNEGVEQDRIGSPQSREIYVQYLEAMIEGRSAFDVAVKLLDEDAFRRHFVLSRSIADLEKALEPWPGLLVKPFENGQTPLSLVLNRPNFYQDQQVELIMAQNPTITTNDLVGLGRCDEFVAAVAEDPALVDKPDPDGNSPISTAMARSYRLENGGCVAAVLNAGANVREQSDPERSLGRSVVLLRDDQLLGLFLSRGFDPEFADAEGMNALHWAASYRKPGAVRTLLEHGVDPSLRNAKGETAEDIVRAYEKRLAASEQDEGSDSDEANAWAREEARKAKAIMALLKDALS